MPKNKYPITLTKIKAGEHISKQVSPGAFVPYAPPKSGVLVKQYTESIFIPREVLMEFLVSEETELTIE